MKINLLIEELNLSARSFNALKKNGIYTVEELINTPQRKLKKIGHLDYKSLNEIKDKVHSLGLELRDEKVKRLREELEKRIKEVEEKEGEKSL